MNHEPFFVFLIAAVPKFRHISRHILIHLKGVDTLRVSTPPPQFTEQQVSGIIIAARLHIGGKKTIERFCTYTRTQTHTDTKT